MMVYIAYFIILVCLALIGFSLYAVHQKMMVVINVISKICNHASAVEFNTMKMVLTLAEDRKPRPGGDVKIKPKVPKIDNGVDEWIP